MDRNTTGVYSITHVASGKCYVGSSARSLYARWDEHQRALSRNKHHSIYLQRAWNKYGGDAFDFAVLDLCPSEECVASEQMHMDALCPEYNMAPVAGSTLGTKRSAETCAKLSAHAKTRKASPETRAKMSASQKRRFAENPLTPKQRAERASRLSSEAVRAKLRGRKHTDETRAKMSASAKRRWARASTCKLSDKGL